MDTMFQQKDRIRVAVVGRNLEDLVPLLKDFPCDIVEESPQLVISHGGDGAFLGAERRYPGVPKCAIRDRRNNPKCAEHDEYATLQKLFRGELRRTELEVLMAETSCGERLPAVNDITLERSQDTSAIRYRIWCDGELLRDQVVADALIVSTPFGSTGYFKSITRGTFLSGIGLAYNNAMDLTGFTVVPTESVLTLQLLRGPAFLLADNNPLRIPLEDDARITLKVHPRGTVLYGLDVFRCQTCYDLRKHGKF